MTTLAAAPLDIASAISDAVASAMPTPSPEEVAADDAADSSTSRVAKTPDSAEAVSDVDATDEASSDAAEDSSGDVQGAEAPDLPDGYVAVPTVTDGLATEFVLRDENGEVEVPALIVEYKANGKIRQDRLDQVVKLAQWGVYNQEREQKLQETVQQQISEYEQLVKQREAQMERLLTDEDFLYAVREAYEAENTPERRVERIQQEKEALRLEYQLQSISQTGEQFYAKEIAPALRMIQQALPSIGPDELESKLQMALQAHVETAPNGVIFVPPSRYDAIRQYIIEDLSLWAQAAHDRRVKPAQQAKVQAELERAQVEAQKAKRAIGQKLKPVGQAGVSPDRPKASRSIVSVDDAVESALSSVLSSIR
jgi:hypothetical protein